MKELAVYLVVIVSVMQSIIGETNTCPPYEEGQEDPPVDILQAHESDCTKFYKCSHGAAVLQDCPSGLQFNPSGSICDWPANVNCTTSSNGNNNDVCVGEDANEILQRHETNCAQYYIIKNDNKLLKDCIAGLKFHPEKNCCDWPENVNCLSIESSKYNEYTPECPAVDTVPDTLFPHETNCSLFYKCYKGEPVVLSCPPNLHFNPIENYCDWPENVNCTNGESNNEFDTNREKVVNGQGESDNCPLENPEVDVLFPHESNCSQFYKCDKGEKVLQDCPSDLHFNPSSNYCDWQENVNCQNGQ